MLFRVLFGFFLAFFYSFFFFLFIVSSLCRFSNSLSGPISLRDAASSAGLRGYSSCSSSSSHSVISDADCVNSLSHDSSCSLSQSISSSSSSSTSSNSLITSWFPSGVCPCNALALPSILSFLLCFLLESFHTQTLHEFIDYLNNGARPLGFHFVTDRCVDTELRGSGKLRCLRGGAPRNREEAIQPRETIKSGCTCFVNVRRDKQGWHRTKTFNLGHTHKMDTEFEDLILKQKEAMSEEVCFSLPFSSFLHCIDAFVALLCFCRQAI